MTTDITLKNLLDLHPADRGTVVIMYNNDGCNYGIRLIDEGAEYHCYYHALSCDIDDLIIKALEAARRHKDKMATNTPI